MLAHLAPVTTACANRHHPTRDHADSRTTRVATRPSAVGESAVSTRTVIHGSNEGQSPRLYQITTYVDFIWNISALERFLEHFHPFRTLLGF
jgi:hypothetical protein